MNQGFRGQVEIVAVGDELGFALPQEIIDRYQLREGDEISLSWDDRGLLLTLKPTDDQSDPQHETSR